MPASDARVACTAQVRSPGTPTMVPDSDVHVPEVSCDEMLPQVTAHRPMPRPVDTNHGVTGATLLVVRWCWDYLDCSPTMSHVTAASPKLWSPFLVAFTLSLQRFMYLFVASSVCTFSVANVFSRVSHLVSTKAGNLALVNTLTRNRRCSLQWHRMVIFYDLLYLGFRQVSQYLDLCSPLCISFCPQP